MEKTKLRAGKLYTFFLMLMMAGSFISTPVFALGNLSTSPTYSNSLYTGHPILSLGGGVAFSSNFGQSQNFPVVDPDTDQFYNYTTNNNTLSRALFDVFIGSEWALSSPWAMQLGFDFSQINTLRTTGTLLQGTDLPSANQYSYGYSLLARQLLAETKVLHQYKNYFYPYFLLGVGAAFNKSYNYSTSIPPFSTFTRQYNNNTQISFSYSLGIGVDLALFKHCRAGIGYRFTDLGQVSLGRTTINTTAVGGTLTQNHLYLNEALVQLSWII